MKEIIYTYFLSLPVIFAFDMVWLGVFARDYYVKMMSPLVAIQFNWFAVPVFYLLYIVGVFIFAVYPGRSEEHTSELQSL